MRQAPALITQYKGGGITDRMGKIHRLHHICSGGAAAPTEI